MTHNTDQRGAHTPGPFILKLERIDAETQEVFSSSETKEHGWKSIADFLQARQKGYNKKSIENGFIQSCPETHSLLKVWGEPCNL
jgi:hypothetical protein